MTETNPESTSRRYELLLILSGKVKDDDVPATLEEIKKVFAKHQATVVDEKLWGRLKFAFEIKMQKAGTYVLWHLDVPADKLQALDAELRVTDNVLRFLLVDNPRHGAVIEPPFQISANRSEPDKKTKAAEDKEKAEPLPEPAPAAVTKEKAKTTLDKTLDEILGDQA